MFSIDVTVPVTGAKLYAAAREALGTPTVRLIGAGTILADSDVDITRDVVRWPVVHMLKGAPPTREPGGGAGGAAGARRRRLMFV